jgi:hypothetical protein
MATTETKPKPQPNLLSTAWNFINGLLPTTSGPVQPQQQQQPFDFVGMANAQNQGQLDRIKAIGELQAQDQARKDAGNQALQNQLASRQGAAWGPNGIFSLPGNVAAVAADRQQRADKWNQVPAWAKMDSLFTPGGMQNALAVSQVQNNPNAVVTERMQYGPFAGGLTKGTGVYDVANPENMNLPQGTTRAPIMQDGMKIGDGIFNAQTHALQGYGLATPASSMPANYPGQLPASYGQPIASQASRDYLGGLVREVGNGVPFSTDGVSPAVAAAMDKANPMWSSFAVAPKIQPSIGQMLGNLFSGGNPRFR